MNFYTLVMAVNRYAVNHGFAAGLPTGEAIPGGRFNRKWGAFLFPSTSVRVDYVSREELQSFVGSSTSTMSRFRAANRYAATLVQQGYQCGFATGEFRTFSSSRRATRYEDEIVVFCANQIIHEDAILGFPPDEHGEAVRID